ncbi:SDR family NAD(P)-dependent oxidoreductase [Corynebacterium dentalis]|nr:SDR family NAD(P)-dependent oxidoreductase [Corynebacterium dentalis]
MDVTKPEDWEAGIADFEANVGQIDVLVNNAGILLRRGVHEGGVL